MSSKKRIYIHSMYKILNEIEDSINNKTPFSLIRFGDGGLKFIHTLFCDDIYSLEKIAEKEGFELKHSIKILNKWGRYARLANYIDCPLVYFNNKFWPRIKKDQKEINSKTKKLLLNWETIYNNAQFDNINYCNPEINYLMCIRIKENIKNLIDIIKDKKICIIGIDEKITNKLKDICNIDFLKINKQFEGQYKNNYNDTIKFIENYANCYDLFLISAGEIGRIYTGTVKENGGRALDMGFVFEYWLNSTIPVRLEKFLTINPNNNLEFLLTIYGKKYKKFF